MYASLTSAFHDINLFGKDGNAERDVYADFLDKASVVLEKPGLKDVANQFRASAQTWGALSHALLPDDVSPFKETRELMVQKHWLFLEQGGAALAEMQHIDARLDAIKAKVAYVYQRSSGRWMANSHTSSPLRSDCTISTLTGLPVAPSHCCRYQPEPQ